MEERVEVNARQTQEALTKLGSFVEQNTEFDQVGQIITLIRLEGEELLSITHSMTNSKLERAVEREAAV